MNCLDYIKNCWIPLTDHKTLEWQFYWETGTYWNWFDLSLSWTRHSDHAGIVFNFELYRFMFNISVCDNRHWDTDNNCYEVYP